MKYGDIDGKGYINVSNHSFMGDVPSEEAAEKIAAAWNEKEPAAEDQAGEDILSREIFRIGLRMGLLAQGEDFLIEAGAPEKIIEEYLESKYTAIAKAAAQRLQLEDYKPLMLKSSRTKEQEKLMTEIAANESIKRLLAYHESNYSRVIIILMAAMAGELKLDVKTMMSAGDDKESDKASAISFLTRYFFALHGELRAEGVEAIDPAAKKNLTEDQEEEVEGLMLALCKYQRRHGGGFYAAISPCFHLENVAAANDMPALTEFAKRDDIFLPVSKAWRRQHDIAYRGSKGLILGVGGNVDIKVTISDKEGKPLQLDGIRRGAQMAIGNLIDSNGGILPIIVTPDQVYREWAGLDSSVDVSDTQAAEMEQAIDSLTSCPSKMDFEAQLREHTIKNKARDYDYKGPNAGRLSGNLITATKIEAARKNGSRTVAYKIYDYPMLYRYSHVVGQIAPVKRSLITGGEDKPVVEKGRMAQRNVRDVSMRHNVLTRIERMKTDKSEARAILLSQVADDLIVELTEKVERTLRKNLEQYLDELKAQGEIKDYRPRMGGRANRKFMGFDILV